MTTDAIILPPQNLRTVLSLAKAFRSALTQACSYLEDPFCDQDFLVACSFMDKGVDAAAQGLLAKDRAKIGCRAKCAYCCYQNVTVTYTECVRLALVARRALPSDLLATVHNAAIRNAAIAANLGQTGRFRSGLACMFLDSENECSVYDMRPVSCRAYYSMDRLRCQLGFVTKDHTMKIPVPGDPVATGEAFSMVFDLMLRARGYQTGRTLLEAGMAKAMEPGCVEAWLAKEQPFRDMPIPAGASRDYSALLDAMETRT